MRERTLSAVAEAVDGRLVGRDAHFRAVSTDTRRIGAGDLFVALRGPRFDGHDFLEQALEAGAAGVLTRRDVPGGEPRVETDDPLEALGRAGRAWRRRFAGPLIGVTGSNGKTTVKGMLRAVMARTGSVCATEGNLNNDIGVPLTLMRLEENHRAAVVEMGANHAGEIAYLCGLAEPTVGLVTNAAPAHLEGFGSLEGVARAKGELFAGLSSGAVAVINADDTYADLWRELARHCRVVTFGMRGDADVRPVEEPRTGADGTRMRLSLAGGDEVSVSIGVPGRHNIMNALAAAAAAAAAGAGPDAIAAGLADFEPVEGRLRTVAGPAGACLLDDSYNANPASLAAALDWLATLDGEGWLVLGDMGELGPESERLHAEAGRRARETGVARLFTIGELSEHAAEAFGPGGRHFNEIDELIETLERDLAGDVNLLVKGSRAMRLERVTAALGRVPAGDRSGAGG